MTTTVRPDSFEEAATALAAAAAAGQQVRIAGAGTKLGWGGAVAGEVTLSTLALDATLEHNAGDLTAIFEAGVPLARVQAEVAERGQMLALDPPLAPPTAGGAPDDDAARSPDGARSPAGATLGGVFATGDCGPLRHRFGQPRDLILGVTVALSDGTIARAGGKVIKNVAGYDLGKLFTGSFGTLGVILSVSVRLHPLPVARVTAVASTDAPELLRDAAIRLARAPLELEALDVAWRAGEGRLLARAAGREASRRADRAAQLMRETRLELLDVSDDDSDLWERQRAGQRSATQAIVRVAARRAQLHAVIAAADGVGASLVGRAAFGTSYLELDPARIAELRSSLPTGAVSTVLDVPPAHRDLATAWDAPAESAAELMRAVKRRFDPPGVCNPGAFVAGI